MKRLAGITLTLVLLAGCGGQELSMQTDIEVPVSVVEVENSSIEEYVTVTGTVDATKEYIVQSESDGFYRLMKNPKTGKLYGIGDYVKKGTVVIKIENPEEENSIRIESQELSLDIAKSEYEKQQSLYEKGGVTLREMREAEKSYIDAKYTYENAVMQLEKLTVTVPFDGIIVDLTTYTDGVKISSGSEMFQIMNYSTLGMEVSIPGKLINEVKPDMAVRVVNYTMPDTFLEGTIGQVSPALDSVTRTFKATVDIKNDDLVLRPGMFVKADIILKKSENTIVIPKDIVNTRRNREFVYIVERGFARERTIETGLENPDDIEILKGIETGERLVISGYETLRNGSRVKIVQ